MRILYSFATICLVGAALAACSSDEPGPAGGGAGAPAAAGASGSSAGAGVGGGATAGDATKGAKVWADNICGSCHGPDAKGKEGPNITMSKTAGIGNWTYQQFHDAVRLAQDNDGTKLCVWMAPLPEADISEAQMKDLYAYVQSQPISDVVNTGTYCP